MRAFHRLFRWAGGGICAWFGDLRMSGECADCCLVRGSLAPEAISVGVAPEGLCRYPPGSAVSGPEQVRETVVQQFL